MLLVSVCTHNFNLCTNNDINFVCRGCFCARACGIGDRAIGEYGVLKVTAGGCIMGDKTMKFVRVAIAKTFGT